LKVLISRKKNITNFVHSKFDLTGILICIFNFFQRIPICEKRQR
jgi:hypothetical protein